MNFSVGCKKRVEVSTIYIIFHFVFFLNDEILKICSLPEFSVLRQLWVIISAKAVFLCN